MTADFNEICNWLFSLHRFGIKLGLEQTRKLADLCGAPDRGLRFIHLAGTNGKGSTGAMLERALRENGFTTGFYSSPHLVYANERIRINGTAVSEEEFCYAAEKIRIAVETMHKEGASPTYFEAITVMALMIFQAHKCDYVVWETGMGGRLDSTNIVDTAISVITNIALDHEKFLGCDLASIASEKAGIIKSGTPVVTGCMAEEAEKVIRDRAEFLQTKYYRASDVAPLDYTFEPLVRPGFQQFKCAGETVKLQLNGVMQQRNAQLVIAVLKVLGLWNSKSLEALSLTRWPARIDSVGNGRFILDGGHNPDGLRALAETLKVLYPGKKFKWLFGAFADKDFSGGLAVIAPLVDELYAVGFAEEARLSATPEAIAAEAGKCGIEKCQAADLKDFLQQELHNAENDKLPVVIAGSLYLAGEVLEVLEKPEFVLSL